MFFRQLRGSILLNHWGFNESASISRSPPTSNHNFCSKSIISNSNFSQCDGIPYYTNNTILLNYKFSLQKFHNFAFYKDEYNIKIVKIYKRNYLVKNRTCLFTIQLLLFSPQKRPEYMTSLPISRSFYRNIMILSYTYYISKFIPIPLPNYSQWGRFQAYQKKYVSCKFHFNPNFS